jgi:proline dehydrogenase
MVQRIELLVTPDCPHAGRARALVERITAEEGVPVRVRTVIVRTLDEAESSDFHGSPTVRIDGLDVEPPPAELPVNLGCRVYARADGSLDGLPGERRIRDSLRGVVRSTAPAAGQGGPADAGGTAGEGAIGPNVRDVPARLSRVLFLWASRRDSLRRLATALPPTRALVARFVAGESLEEALLALASLRAAGLRTTVDVLGESVESEGAARDAADRYIETLDALAPEGFDGNVSLKLTQMGLDIDAAFCRDNVRRVLERAAKTGAFVRIDMEDHTRTDATLAIARELRANHPELGVVIQSYLRRSAADVELLIRERTRVRLCKGAYDEPASVAFASKAQVDESYRRLMERLLLEGNYPGIATHDERLIDHARRFAAEHGVAPSRFEFQMLYGVRRDLQRRLVRDGYTVRVYVPYGAEWYPYFMRRLAERPANLLFLLRSLARERRDPESRAA